MVAQNDSNNNVRKPGAYLHHRATAMSILKRPTCPNSSRHHQQQLQRSRKSLLRRRALITTVMSSEQRSEEAEEGANSSEHQPEATNESSHAGHDAPTSSPLPSMTDGVLQTIGAHNGEPLSTVEWMMIKLLPQAATNHESCEQVLRVTRQSLRFDFILYDLGLKPETKLLLQGRSSSSLMSAVRNVLYGFDQQCANELYATLSNINDAVCQFVCCSMLFVDKERDPFFTALDLDKVMNILSPQSLAVFAKMISFIRPAVQSLRMSPVCDQMFVIVQEPLMQIVRATATSMRRLTVYLPDDQMVEVLRNARFTLVALEELCLMMRGERIYHYNAPEASNAIHGLYARVSSICPRLKYVSLHNGGAGSVPVVNMKWLPTSVDHIVNVRDTDLLRSVANCAGVRTITIHVANIDFGRFVLFEREGGFPQLERVNLVNCVLQEPKLQMHHASARLRACIRTIINDPSDAIPYFPVEGLPWFVGDLPSLEVVELYLNTEADTSICESLVYAVNNLPCLKSLTIQVWRTKLCEENVGGFRALLQMLEKSECELEHLRMPNMWACSSELYAFLESKGASLKTLDVKMHCGSCVNEETTSVLNWEDVVEVLRRLADSCPRILNASVAESDVLQRALDTNRREFESCVSHEKGGKLKRMWEQVVLGFDREKVSCEILRDAMRDVFRERMRCADEGKKSWS